ncbi:MAG: hypothetical protein OCD00_02885 [Colwellia sp.]
METTQILKEAKNQKDDYKIESFEELKSAIESKKLLKEIAGMQFNRWAGIITSLTALISVIVIISQSGVNNTRSYKDALDSNIEVLEFKKKGLENDKKLLEDEITSQTIKINKSDLKIHNLKDNTQNAQKLKNEADRLEIKVNELSKSIKEKKIELSNISDKVNFSNKEKALLEAHQALKVELSAKEEEYKLAKSNLIKMNPLFNKYKEEIKNLKSALKEEKLLLSNFKKSTGLVSPEWQKMALTRKGTGKEIGGYTIKLTNVGNIKNNMDLKISLKDSSSGINYFNLDQGNTVVLRFNEAIFFIKIKKAEQSKIRAEEEGSIEVLLFKGGKKDKGDKGIRYRIVS